MISLRVSETMGLDEVVREKLRLGGVNNRWRIRIGVCQKVKMRCRAELLPPSRTWMFYNRKSRSRKTGRRLTMQTDDDKGRAKEPEPV